MNVCVDCRCHQCHRDEVCCRVCCRLLQSKCGFIAGLCWQNIGFFWQISLALLRKFRVLLTERWAFLRGYWPLSLLGEMRAFLTEYWALLNGCSALSREHISLQTEYRASAHGGDPTSNIWISRFLFSDVSVLLIDHLSDGDSVYSGKTSFRFFGESRENLVDMYGDSRENSLENFAVVIILSTISSVRGFFSSQNIGLCWLGVGLFWENRGLFWQSFGIWAVCTMSRAILTEYRTDLFLVDFPRFFFVFGGALVAWVGRCCT